MTIAIIIAVAGAVAGAGYGRRSAAVAVSDDWPGLAVVDGRGPGW